MTKNAYSFHSKVGRRIFLIFLSCAILPISALTLLSYQQVAHHLKEQSHLRLRHASKNIGMAVFENLTALNDEMLVLATLYPSHPDQFGSIFPRQQHSLDKHFISLAIIEGSGEKRPLLRDMPPARGFSAVERAHLAQGKTLFWVQFEKEGNKRAFLAAPLVSSGSGQDLLVGEISIRDLFRQSLQALSLEREVLVLSSKGAVVFGTRSFPAEWLEKAGDHLSGGVSGEFEMAGEEGGEMVGYWTIFFRGTYAADDWSVFVLEPHNSAFAALSHFRKNFYLVALLSLWVVLLFSSVYIRKTLTPLKMLKEGTRRLSEGDLSQRVEIDSADEFQELSLSFNGMADKIEEQFSTLEKTGKTIRLILADLDRDKIVDTLLTRMNRIVRCDWVSVTFERPGKGGFQTCLASTTDEGGARQRFDTDLGPSELEALRAIEEFLVTDTLGSLSVLLSPIRDLGARTCLVLPVGKEQKVTGVLILGYHLQQKPRQEDVIRTRAIADQVGIALANASLVDELANLNFDTLMALARTVDAKSTWTAGHSERVTKIAMAIGGELKLSQGELDQLHRASLLHDIGKIAVPNLILDKANRLTETEYQLVQSHPDKGVRILEPIRAYRDVLPIVAQHHEWFDGRGYPLGLKGEKICLGARILAVADVYDALISHRPYRPAREAKEVLLYMQKGAGSQFDPEVVNALLNIEDSVFVPSEAQASLPV
ncbi:putative metal dependent phosphohydrolase [Desulfuromonas soudanensis]|uniref:Putative metal dependent phosphohydrolase n=1 Tax=Desulfuromonas soudanensis TaxID=1603606 RepID=A0A0M4D228_9BACT|nr:HD domain-containing phosphohydrolase [Desulfuromonas soudanensis]ALC16288.1 putative metal dependent phosphohydrolase [Desulfuromonas soudanensis]